VTVTATRRPGLRSRRRREWLRNLAFLSPWLLGTGLFFLYPLATTAYLSFTRYDGFVSPTWNGLDNWRYVFRDYSFFWPAMRNTLWFVVVLVTLRIVAGLVLGLLVIHVKRGNSTRGPARSTRSLVISAFRRRAGSTTRPGRSPRSRCWRCGGWVT
jgi:multiple sugar transport system permease protein